MNKNIVYVSLLKPISDPRANKILGSIKEHYPNNTLHIIATEDDSIRKRTNHNHPLPKHLSRKEKRQKAFLICKNLDADIIIFNNIDFYWYSILHFSFPTFIYDIRENFSKNIRYQKHYKGISKFLLPKIIQSLEWLSSNFTYGTILAENCYNNELKNRVSTNTIILQNKAKNISYSPTTTRNNFFITGTLSEEYGTLTAINWFISYNKSFPESRLKITGKVSSVAFEQILTQEINDNPSINSTFSTDSIPYHKILQSIKENDIGLLPYQNNPCFDNKIPTKLYEYLSAGKIILTQKNHLYNSLLSEDQNSHFIDFSDYSDEKHQKTHALLPSLTPQQQSPTHNWTSEEEKLTKFLKKLLH